MPRAILTIEDDPAIRRGIVDALEYAGFYAAEAGNVAQGLPLALSQQYDLLLLDIILPDGDGLQILGQVRESNPRQPVILLTARGDENDRVTGLRMGADDYIVKPFSVKELLARIDAVLRRAPPSIADMEPIDVNGRGQIDVVRGMFTTIDGESIVLSPREIQIVTYLAAHAGRPVSRDEILEQVWGIDARGVTTRTIDMHISRLREKLGDDSSDSHVIVTVRSCGYLWRVA